jgi:hypothetical protein
VQASLLLPNSACQWLGKFGKSDETAHQEDFSSPALLDVGLAVVLDSRRGKVASFVGDSGIGQNKSIVMEQESLGLKHETLWCFAVHF